MDFDAYYAMQWATCIPNLGHIGPSSGDEFRPLFVNVKLSFLFRHLESGTGNYSDHHRHWWGLSVFWRCVKGWASSVNYTQL